MIPGRRVSARAQRYDDAIADCRKSLQLKPDFSKALSLTLPPLPLALSLSTFSGSLSLCDPIYRLLSCSLARSLALPIHVCYVCIHPSNRSIHLSTRRPIKKRNNPSLCPILLLAISPPPLEPDSFQYPPHPRAHVRQGVGRRYATEVGQGGTGAGGQGGGGAVGGAGRGGRGG
jgi:hypothetical protein